ncbi:hypothetical protein SUGI_0204480 [Cryptomeria japonica]|nr:hypothetical protein SUGI_0204480 [Cryptomeria japonica]
MIKRQDSRANSNALLTLSNCASQQRGCFLMGFDNWRRNKEKKRPSIQDITNLGDGNLKQLPLHRASPITNSSMPVVVSQSTGFVYPSSMGRAALVNSMRPPIGGNPLMLPPNPHGGYSQNGHSYRYMVPGSTLGVPQMGYPMQYPMQPTMHD